MLQQTWVNIFYVLPSCSLALNSISSARKEISQKVQDSCHLIVCFRNLRCICNWTDYRDLSYVSLHPRQKHAVANYGGGGEDAGHVPQRHGDTRGTLFWQE